MAEMETTMLNEVNGVPYYRNESVPVVREQIGFLEKDILIYLAEFETVHNVRIGRIKLTRKEGNLKARVIVEI